MENKTFNKGERVYVAGYGWGTVSIDRHTHFVLIDFDDFKHLCGVDVNRNFVSYTKYFLQNFSQERPINYKDYIGKWGKFKSRGLKRFVIDKLKSVEFHEKNSFCAETDRTYYYEFEPLTEEQIKFLGLE